MSRALMSRAKIFCPVTFASPSMRYRSPPVVPVHTAGVSSFSSKRAPRSLHEEGDLAQLRRFAVDSPLEGDGFKLPVPRQRRHPSATAG